MRDSPRPSTDKGAQAEATHGECGEGAPTPNSHLSRPRPSSPRPPSLLPKEPAAQEGGGPRQASGLP